MTVAFLAKNNDDGQDIFDEFDDAETFVGAPRRDDVHCAGPCSISSTE